MQILPCRKRYCCSPCPSRRNFLSVELQQIWDTMAVLGHDKCGVAYKIPKVDRDLTSAKRQHPDDDYQMIMTRWPALLLVDISPDDRLCSDVSSFYSVETSPVQQVRYIIAEATILKNLSWNCRNRWKLSSLKWTLEPVWEDLKYKLLWGSAQSSRSLWFSTKSLVTTSLR